jgi:hypothetical protein
MEIMNIVLDTMRWELQASNDETAHTNPGNNTNAPAAAF